MGAKEEWNHDAFFDYLDRWMDQTDPHADHRGEFPRPKLEGKSVDSFVDAMWTDYREKIPQQPGARENRKWIGGHEGDFEPNLPPGS